MIPTDDGGIRLPDDWSDLFGDVIFSYTDDQAVEDGVLVPLYSAGKDTRHRVTRSAFVELRDYHQELAEMADDEFGQYVLRELLPLAGFAAREWDSRSILKTDYQFRVRRRAKEVLWYVPNEVGGITIMKPQDY